MLEEEMPIQELAPVTSEEVEEAIAALESQYDITSAEFLNVADSGVADDDAAEWLYLLKQREVIQAVSRQRIISSFTASATPFNLVYGFATVTRRERKADDRRLQYDCAA
jgi:hypothetical protein